MANVWIIAAFTVFVWWFSTGAILMAVKHADRGDDQSHMRTVLLGLPLLILGIFGVWLTRDLATITGAYIAFLSALAIWGWIELAFLCGIITGPNSRPSPSQSKPLERFLCAWGTIAHSEILLLVSFTTIAALTWEAANSIAMWTFAVLFFARISAKLNVYLGVPNINVEFLPAPMRHLASHFRVAPMNWFFPVGVSLLTFACACWMERAYMADDAAGFVGFVLLATLTALAIIEHWVMVLPIPDAVLWRWLVAATEKKPELPSYLSEEK